ncbi:MAG: flavodoxin family protein [Desulfobacteraceae bacterium]|nr:flavodoxin family protein [Desulfobacteraceae bacterium]
MKILSILGSPRKKGNTAAVLGWVDEALTEAGHQVEQIFLGSKNINGCLDCGKCKENMEHPGCVQKDDAPAIFDRMMAADAVIFASPLYYWGFSSQMKTLIDRCYCLYRGSCGALDHMSFIDGKRQALIVTAADAFENNAELTITAFQRSLVYNKTTSAGQFMVCNTTTPDALSDGIKSQATAFAGQMFTETPAPYALLIPGNAPHLVPVDK